MRKLVVMFLLPCSMHSFSAWCSAMSPIPSAIAEHQGPVRVAVIRSLNDDISRAFIEGAVKEGEKLGFRVDAFTSFDDARFQDLVEQAVSEKYDGIILSHGKAPYSSGLAKKIASSGIKLSLFETPIDMPISGVTVTSQDDESLARESAGQLIRDFKGKANIVKLWVSGYPPMERRQVVYQKLKEENPHIREIASLGAVSQDVEGDTAKKMQDILNQYPKGKIDAIWGTWDAFSRGAYQALKESDRTEIRIYSIDVSDRDIQLMREQNSPWVMTAAVDAGMMGAVNMRLIALKIAGEPTPLTYEFSATVITQHQLSRLEGESKVASLAQIMPGWGANTDFIAPWFATLEAKYKPQ